MVKMKFVPHISKEILIGPSMSQSEKCMAILRRKEVFIINVRLLENRKSNGQKQEDDIIYASSLDENIVWQKGRDMVI